MDTMGEHHRDIGHDYTYRTYPQRWRMLFIISVFNFFIQIAFTTFMPVATVAAAYYDVGLTAINWLAIVWAAVFLPCTVVAGWAVFKHGVRNCLRTCGGVLLLGALLRALSAVYGGGNAAPPAQQIDGQEAPLDVPDSKPVGAYILLIVGSMVMALVQPLVLSSTTLMAASWFSENERNLANTLVRFGDLFIAA